LKDRILFFLLFFCVVTLTFVHNIFVLFILFTIFFILNYKIAFKTIKAILFFNLSITLGVIVESFFIQKDIVEYLLLFNLRVFDITFLTLFISSKINLLKAVSFSTTLQFLLSATLSQIQSFSKTYEEFMMALKSRTIKKLNERKRKEFLQSMFYFFFKKSLHNSKEKTMALKARGFFDKT